MNKNLPIILIFIFCTAVLQAQEDSKWVPFSPKYNFEESVFGMKNWLDAPAGKHGFVQIENENLIFEDGTAIKFWGTNICSSLPYIDTDEADRFVDFLSQYGVNAIRFHKFTKPAYSEKESTILKDDKWKNFDYFQAALKKQGIYYGWSHIYGQKVLPGDSNKIVAYAEIKNLNYPWSHLNGSTSSLVNFAPDLQDLSIELTVNMLNHVNPHTGLRYADDPALAFIEFQNEDDIFWGAIRNALEQAPTYRSMLCKQFSIWLKEKYGTQSALVKAWGSNNIPEGETLEKLNIYPAPNHGMFSWEYETSLKENRPMARHILDKMYFLYETQLKFYKRFEKAIRQTGYKGVLVGSCWQAGSGVSHYYNLHTDYEVGMIDRHYYFGGGSGGHRLAEGEVKNGTMISRPGSGLLSAGLQQVADRPFSFSEWMSLVPNEFTSEATALIAFYGMGLQGWDASFSFATDLPRFSRLLESERHGVYNATSPLHMGLYPALARMVFRNDIKESPIISTRNVHIPSLKNGNLGFGEFVEQGHDQKIFTGVVPIELLAVGRFPAKFTKAFEETIIPDVSEYWDESSNTIKSVTGELTWNFGENKYALLNTSSTKGVVGFTGGKEIVLDNWEIKTSNKFAVILISDLSKNGNLEESDQILITTVARARNTEMKYEYSADGKTFLRNRGKDPLLLEPVKVEISYKTNDKFEVKVLDHDGVLTKVPVPVKNNSFTLDGAKYKTMYYLISKK